MTDESVSAKFARGEVLQGQGRFEDAAGFFRDAISSDPNFANAYSRLALCQLEIDGQRKQALATIDQAIALDPEFPGYHAVRGLILTRRNKGKEALAAADQAIALDPGFSFAFAVKAGAFLELNRWPEAEQAARQALALDADNDYAANLLATALRVQGKNWESEVQVKKLLSDNPEDEIAHFNAGWAALQRHDYREAEKHFLESLRLDPDFDGAREGLLESFKARSPFYRTYLRYCFFMQRFTQGARWLLIIGLLVGARVLRTLASTVHPAAATAVTVVYLLFVFWVWVASGIGHFMVSLDKNARHALTRRETLEGWFVGGGMIAGIVIAVVAMTLGKIFLAIFGGALAVAAVPASLTFTNDSKQGRLVFGGIMSFIYFAGLWFLAAEFVAAVPKPPVALVWMSIIAGALCTWLGNVPALREGVED